MNEDPIMRDLAYWTDQQILDLARNIDTGIPLPGVTWTDSEHPVAVLANRREFIRYLQTQQNSATVVITLKNDVMGLATRRERIHMISRPLPVMGANIREAVMELLQERRAMFPGDVLTVTEEMST